ncbi:MAG: hypothetical protein R3C05_29580 [Pirellulaceae bacterium]
MTGAIDGLVESYRKRSTHALVYLTGGDATLISDALRCRPTVVADLPLHALFAVGRHIVVEA